MIDEALILIDDIKFEITIVLLVLCLVRAFMRSLYDRPNIPGPFPWPIIGNAIALGDQPQRSMKAMAEKYGPIYLMKLGSADVLVLNDYDSIKEALGRQRNVFSGRPQFDSFKKISQGKGIVFNSELTHGKDWQKMKMSVIRQLHKYISARNTKALLGEHIRKESIELVKTLDELCRNSPTGTIEPEPTLNISTANIVCAFMFGHRYDYNNKEFQDLISLNRQFGEVVGAGSQVDVMPWIKVIPTFRKALKLFNFLTDRLNNWMLLRTTEHRSQYVDGITRDIVDMFIEEGIKHPNGLMKDDIIMALTTDVFGAAQDTLSTTVQWMFIYMMYFPEIQRKIHKELDFELGNDALPDITNQNLFPYTEAVMHEVFRHSTFTSTTIPHTTTKPTVLGGYKIPKGMLVFINQFAANHDTRYWKDPEEFRPERFLTKEGKLINKPHETYLLFSYGSRRCPGDELSRMLLMYMFTLILSLCEVQSDPKCPTTLDAVYNLSMRPKTLRTRLHVRKPLLLRKLISSQSTTNSHIPTVNPYTSSFISPAENMDSDCSSHHNSVSLGYSQFSDDEENTMPSELFGLKSTAGQSFSNDINGNIVSASLSSYT